jgi:2-dehydro-3-deoxyglucarate aldolase/4-hydroxy-2-oxoheptanedioate aldolase
MVAIKRILDSGAQGVLVPYVNTRAEAEAAVAAVKYPLQGVRGVAASPRAPGYGLNSLKGYLGPANAETLVLAAAETPAAVAHLDEILSVEGLDGIFIGPMDLATSMGHFCDPAHPEVQAAVARIESKVKGSGKTLATLAGGSEDARAKFDRGYQMLLVMSDSVTLGQVAAEKVAEFRKLYPRG